MSPYKHKQTFGLSGLKRPSLRRWTAAMRQKRTLRSRPKADLKSARPTATFNPDLRLRWV
jgi:hypothetical protein